MALDDKIYLFITPGSLSQRISGYARRRMFDIFIDAVGPLADDSILDVGVTSDRLCASSNYFEALYPHKSRITATGIDDCRFLENLYPGLRFVCADGCDLPFEDNSFDIVHSSAVIEHVGGRDRQIRFLRELVRIARRCVFVTTPNRWFPVEFHTILPLVHWLPDVAFRRIVRTIRGPFYADQNNLRLLTISELSSCCRQAGIARYSFRRLRLLGWTSNIILLISKGQVPNEFADEQKMS